MMNIVVTRRICQVFFLLLFMWFCVVATVGQAWHQLRGWPVNWFLQLDPLVGIGVLLTTHTVYAGLLWGAVTLILTFFLGRFFCGWVCPMGTLQQFAGYIGQRNLSEPKKIQRNRPHRAQQIKYWILLFFLSAAGADLLRHLLALPASHPLWAAACGILLVLVLWGLRRYRRFPWSPGLAVTVGCIMMVGVIWQWRFPQTHWLSTSLQIGLLDPIAFLHRAVNLVLLPLADRPLHVTSAMPRLYEGSGLVGALFIGVILLCLRFPRCYCRFVCPLGALLGIAGRWALWRIGKSEDRCRQCQHCEAHCEGACTPAATIHTSECVLCLNCMDSCRHSLMGYRLHESASGEVPGPDLERRQVASAVAAGLISISMLRVNGLLADNWRPLLIRPPGALAEKEFLARCIKCGQCMRICPTNVIQPAHLQAGAEGLWTPILNFRIGSSGCQHNCVACSHICPTAAIRPIDADQRMGRRAFTDAGPLRIGMAFVDRGRCLPWAMDTPCIVCQENCPVSPKAIFTRTVHRTIRDGEVRVHTVDGHRYLFDGSRWPSGALGSGDYVITWNGQPPVPIIANHPGSITVAPDTKGYAPLTSDQKVYVMVKLQQPYVDPQRCIGCGVCEHECPVQGRRAIRVTAENETRHPKHQLILR